MKKIINVNALDVGMYVTRVTRSDGSAIMKSKGLLKDESSIRELKDLNVFEVEIDMLKSEHIVEADDEGGNAILNGSVLEQIEKPQRTALTQEMRRAQAMYVHAREVQVNTFKQIQSGGRIDLEIYEQIASTFLDSVFRNQDALLLMTKMQDKDAYLLEHSINVAILLAVFSKHLGMSKDIGLKLTLAGLLHDMGKVKVPDEILLKQGKLTKDEFQEIKKHTTYGADILKASGMDGLTIQIALEHHERLSGSGYPSGLLAHQLNQYVRMSAIVDVFDAITAERVYKSAMTAFQAFKVIRDGSKSDFDAELLNQFIRAIGLFSIGSIVMMTNQKLAIVTETNYEDPLKPTVTIFYHTKFHRHIEPMTVDLTSKKVSESIDKVVNPTDFGIDINAIIERFIIEHCSSGH